MIKFIGNEAELFGWLNAEKALAKSKVKPIPEGWITVEEYATRRKPRLSKSQAAKILLSLYRAKLADRQRWPMPSQGGYQYIYRLTHSRNGKR